MIFGNINQEKTYEFLPENVKACFKYVKEHDLLNYEKWCKTNGIALDVQKVYHDENGNAHTWFPPEVDSGGGVGGGYQPVAPKAKAIFRNSNMTDNSWKTIENLLDKMTKTKIGEALYHKLQEALKGKTLIIQFVSDNMNSNFVKKGWNLLLASLLTAYSMRC